MNYTHKTWSLKCGPSQLKNIENLPPAPSHTGHKAVVHLCVVSLYSIVSSVLIYFLHNHTILLPIFFTEIGKYSKEILFANDLQMQRALTLISKPAAHTVLVCFPSCCSVTPQCHFLCLYPLAQFTDSFLLIEENSLVLLGE